MRAFTERVLLACACLGVGYLVARGVGSPSYVERVAARDHGALPEARHDEAAVASLRAEVRAMREDVRALHARESASAMDPVHEEDVRSTLPSPEEQAAEQSAAHAFYADAHAREHMDTAWARSQETALWQRIEEAGATLEVQSITCRSATCRIDYASLDPRASSEWLSLLQAPPFPGRGLVLRGTEGGGAVYVPREGRTLPRFALR